MAKILIVDDENNIRLMLRLALKADGHEITTAAEGGEALDLFDDGTGFDLVLLDQRMPGMEGLDVLRIMKRRTPHSKIIMATAFGTVDLARDAMAAGASGFLRKPFTTEILRSAVASALAGTLPQPGSETGNGSGETHFDAVSVNGFRLDSVGKEGSIARHQFLIHAAGAAPTPCVVEFPPFFIELVKAQADRDNLENDPDFWRWLGEEALANSLWQNAAPPENGVLVVDELTSNLKRWMDAVLTR